MQNYRKDIINAIIPYFRTDPRYHLLVGDMGFGAIDTFKEEFPERITNFGIMEQGAVGIAAGMSMSGMIPVVYTIINFLAFRAIEQVRNDIVLQGLNVKLIGTGANDYFQMLGPSHTCGRDDVTIMELIKMKTYDPYLENKDFTPMIDAWMTDTQAGYLRV